ncbi:ricin-type beta-trefoil lectin domain protein, partial [Streptomyces sp. SID6648]|nr:ricin-type beta-trefoil lectin domain protein [Streptomyces sp. SID6648]
MARRTRSRRLLGAAVLTSLATGAALLGAPVQAAPAAASVTVRPDPSYQQEEFEGWGTSLVWFANATGDYPPEIREKLA